MIGVSPCRAQRAGDVAAVAVGQVQVEQHEVGIDSLGDLDRLGHRRGDDGLEPLPHSAFENGSKIDGSSSTNKIRGPVTRATVACPAMAESKAVLITGCSSAHRSRDRRATGEERLDGLRDRARQGQAVRPGRAGLQDAPARRRGRGVDEGGGRRGRAGGGRHRRADQQRRLLAERRRRERPDGQGAQAVRDERLRPGPDDSASAAEDARAGLRPDREHLLDGRKLVFPGGGFYHATKYAVEAISDACATRSRASASTSS